MLAVIDRKCKYCQTPFKARAADVKRGWGLYCSKHCKAVRQEQRTGQYANMLARPDSDTAMHEAAMDDLESGWDGHKNVC